MAGSDEFYSSYHSIYGKVVAVDSTFVASIAEIKKYTTYSNTFVVIVMVAVMIIYHDSKIL